MEIRRANDGNQVILSDEETHNLVDDLHRVLQTCEEARFTGEAFDRLQQLQLELEVGTTGKTGVMPRPYAEVPDPLAG